MASNDLNEEELLLELIKSLSGMVAAPLVIDCTVPALVAKAVKCTPGRPIINSINLESEARFDGMADVMSEYGVPAVAMCIGTKGMARTAADKLAVAEELFERGKKWGLREEQYVFDVLTFPITT
jgi:5-methyltetrahydrofolate--homocysteine methyltransferase